MMKNIASRTIEVSFIAKMTQFSDIIQTLYRKRTGNDSSSIYLDRNNEIIDNEYAAGAEISVTFSEGEIDLKGHYSQHSYDIIKGIDYIILDKFFNRLYEKNQIRFPEQKLYSFYDEEKKYFEELLEVTEVRLKDYNSLVKDILLFINKKSSQIEALPPQQNEKKTNKLKVKQIALIHVYEAKQITRENAGNIAAQHGYVAKTSGEGLFQDYTTYCSTANRKGKPTPCTPITLKNKIELFESVINYLTDSNKQRAIDELNILKTIFESEFQERL